MPIAFVDVHGIMGRIDDDLSLAYNGPSDIAEAVEGIISEIEAEVETTEDRIESLLIELGQIRLMKEVTRTDLEGSRPGDLLFEQRDTP